MATGMLTQGFQIWADISTSLPVLNGLPEYQASLIAAFIPLFALMIYNAAQDGLDKEIQLVKNIGLPVGLFLFGVASAAHHRYEDPLAVITNDVLSWIIGGLILLVAAILLRQTKGGRNLIDKL